MTRHETALKKLHEGTVIPATPLALTEDHKLDEKGQRLLMNYYLDCGVGGVATAVHTTQFEIHKPEVGMLEPVLRIVSEEIDRYERETGKVIVKVAGVCGPLEQAVKEAALAKQYGYDAVLLSPSGLAALDEQAMLARTKAVAEVMPVIGFYLQTAAGGRVFTYDYWEQLCAIPNVVAIKCASFNRYTTIDVVRAAAKEHKGHLEGALQEGRGAQHLRLLGAGVCMRHDLHHVNTARLLCLGNIENALGGDIFIGVRGHQHLRALGVNRLDQLFLLLYRLGVIGQLVGVLAKEVSHHVNDGGARLRDLKQALCKL